MKDLVETERLVLFPFTEEGLKLFNESLPRFEEAYGVVYDGEEPDGLLRDFLRDLEKDIAADPGHYLFFTQFQITLKEDAE